MSEERILESRFFKRTLKMSLKWSFFYVNRVFWWRKEAFLCRSDISRPHLPLARVYRDDSHFGVSIPSNNIPLHDLHSINSFNSQAGGGRLESHYCPFYWWENQGVYISHWSRHWAFYDTSRFFSTLFLHPFKAFSWIKEPIMYMLSFNSQNTMRNVINSHLPMRFREPR